MTGPGIWIRIQHRFGPRMTEWLVAVQTALWGYVLLLPAQTFEGRAWEFFRGLEDAGWLSESQLGWAMLLLGLARIGGLIVNGARKTVTPWIRVFSAAVGLFIWVGVSYSFAQSGVISTWIAIYPVIAGVELLNIWRAANDVGESYGTP